MKGFLGVDVGSVSTNIVVLDESGQLLAESYLRTSGRPIEVVQEGIYDIGQELAGEVEIAAAGTTGSARYLTSMIVGADVVKNEITCHAVAASKVVPGVRTIIE